MVHHTLTWSFLNVNCYLWWMSSSLESLIPILKYSPICHRLLHYEFLDWIQFFPELFTILGNTLRWVCAASRWLWAALCEAWVTLQLLLVVLCLSPGNIESWAEMKWDGTDSPVPAALHCLLQILGFVILHSSGHTARLSCLISNLLMKLCW